MVMASMEAVEANDADVGKHVAVDNAKVVEGSTSSTSSAPTSSTSETTTVNSSQPANADVNTNTNVTATPNTNVNQTPSQPKVTLEGPELLAAIKVQIEYYFSPQNLANDTYLAAQMDPDSYVPLNVIMGFSKMKRLTSDVNLVFQALEDSTKVEVDKAQMRLKPNIPKPKRTTVMLRDMPPSATVETITEVFEKGEVKDVESIKPDILNCWFVNFKDEEAAMKGLEFVRTATYEGQPIRARLKAENTLKPTTGFVYTPSAQAITAAVSLQAQHQGGDAPLMGAYGYYPHLNPYMMPMNQGRGRGYGGQGGYRQGAPNDKQDRDRRYDRRQQKKDFSGNNRRGSGRPASGAAGQPLTGVTGGANNGFVQQHTSAAAGTGSHNAGRDDANGKKRKNSTKRKGGGKQTASNQAFQLAPSHFPPLPTRAGAGYKEPFKKYDPVEIVAAIREFKNGNELKRPSYLLEDHVAIRAEPQEQLVLETLKFVTEEPEEATEDTKPTTPGKKTAADIVKSQPSTWSTKVTSSSPAGSSSSAPVASGGSGKTTAAAAKTASIGGSGSAPAACASGNTAVSPSASLSQAAKSDKASTNEGTKSTSETSSSPVSSGEKAKGESGTSWATIVQKQKAASEGTPLNASSGSGSSAEVDRGDSARRAKKGDSSVAPAVAVATAKV